MKLSKLAVIAIAVFCMISVSAKGNEISIPLSTSGWSMVVSSDTVGGGQIDGAYTYGISGDAVTIEIDKTFDHAFNGQSYQPVLLQFQKTSANAVPNIIINDEYVVNSTGTEWHDFHMNLASAPTTAPMAGFNASSFPSGDQLENVYYSDNVGYNGLPTQLNFVDTDGHGVLTSLDDNIFKPGSTSGKIIIVTNPQMQVGSSFTLTETPSAPEPATVLMLGMGGLAILRKKRQVTA